MWTKWSLRNLLSPQTTSASWWNGNKWHSARLHMVLTKLSWQDLSTLLFSPEPSPWRKSKDLWRHTTQSFRTDTHTRSNTSRYVLNWNEGRSRAKPYFWGKLWNDIGFVLAVLGDKLVSVGSSQWKGRLGEHPSIWGNHVDRQTGKGSPWEACGILSYTTGWPCWSNQSDHCLHERIHIKCLAWCLAWHVLDLIFMISIFMQMFN